MRTGIPVFLCLLLLASTAFADFYRWVDKDGREFFTNDRRQIPAEYQDAATVVRPDDSRVSVAEKPGRPAAPGPDREHRDRYGHGEEYWRRRAENLRLKLRHQEDEYELVQKQLDEQEQKPRRSGRKSKHSSLEKKKMKLEKEIAQTRREVEVNLPEDARKADAYPGWLRE